MGTKLFVVKDKEPPFEIKIVIVAILVVVVPTLFIIGVPLLLVGGAIAAALVAGFVAIFRTRAPLDVAQQNAGSEALYNRATERLNTWIEGGGNDRLYNGVCAALAIAFPNPLLDCVSRLLDEEDYLWTLKKQDWSTMPLSQAASLRNLLRETERFLDNPNAEQHLIDALTTLLRPCVAPFQPASDSLFSIPYYATLPAAQATLLHIFESVARYERLGMLQNVSSIITENMLAYSGIAPDVETTRQPIPFARSGLTLQAGIETYLKGTPLYDTLLTPVSVAIPQEVFFGHTHIVGGTGAGKTQFLQSLILHHWLDETNPAIVVVDSQGDMINKVAHLPSACWRRTLLISPRELQALSINVFDLKRLSSYDPAAQEQVVAGAIETLDYLFSGIVGADLTAKQSVFFRFISRLLITLPQTMGRNATLLDVLALLDDATPYQPAIAALPPIQRAFFERDFQSKTFQQTKEQVRYRINAIFENPTLQRLFTAEKSKLDIFTELNDGTVILIDTAKDYLKSASPHFGRILIALVLQAVLERASIAEKDRRPAFLIVDEAAEYFDQNIDDLLTQVRKYKLGCVFAHQYLDQCTSGLRASLAANTAIKMAAGVSTADARALAPDLRTSADFILAQPKLHFATYIRGVTSEAVSTPVEAGRLESRKLMSDEKYQTFLERNRERVTHTPPAALPRPTPANPVPVSLSQDTIDTTPARKW